MPLLKPTVNSLWTAKTKSFLSSVWFFPSVLVLILCILTALNLNGSSIGIYHGFLYGDTKDANLVAGKPQPIRSDEWLVNTQMIITQQKNDYQRINSHFAEDKDMSLVVDVPYREWSVFFKPQNLAFFILPLEYAFAFKWWFFLVALLLSVYFFCLKLLPGKIWVAITSSIIIAGSPFVFWWYQISTIGSLAYGFLILLMVMKIIDGNRLIFFKKTLSNFWSSVIRVGILSYLLTAFALLLYPPFQIPIGLVVFFFSLGYLLLNIKGKKKKQVTTILLSLLASITIVGSICGAYVLSRSDVISTITNTAYPGKRVVSSGGYDIKRLLVTYLQPQLQREGKGVSYFNNQSESSNFILLPLVFLTPSIALLFYLYVKQKKFEWVLCMIILCNLLFLAQLFLPNIDAITKLFLLYLVPHGRLIIGLGFVSIVLVIYCIKLLQQYKFKYSKQISIALAVYLIIFFALVLWAGLETSKEFPAFVSSKKLLLLLASVTTVGSAFIIFNRPKIGLLVIALFSFFSVIGIHPLYRGLGPIYDSEITRTIQSLSPPNSTWAAAQSIYIENIPQISNRTAITGVSAYPSNKFWKHNSEQADDAIYNRYAHIFLSSNDSAPMVLVGADLFAVSSSCDRKVSREIDFIISVTPLDGRCMTLLKDLPYPNVNFYFYKVSH